MSEGQLLGSVVGGKYRVLRMLGQGGMGVVYEGQNTVTGKRVALKCLHHDLVENADATERFLREARVASRVNHANVVDLYDVIKHDQAFFLVMEYLEGESLGDYLERGQHPVVEIVRLLVDAMRGLSAVHKQGIVHRDLKPDNIFLAREGDDDTFTPKLLDFGIAKLLTLDTGQLKLTRTGSTFGTPRYTSYEQLMGYADVDARADVYSFGVILYEALTGQAPYPALNFQQLLVQFTSIKPVPPRQHRPELPQALEAVIMQALSQDRALRPQSIEALIAAIKPFATASAPVRVSLPAMASAPTRALKVQPAFHAAPTAPAEVPVDKPKVRSVPPRRERAFDYGARDASDAKPGKGGLRNALGIGGCVLVALTLWLLKPGTPEATAPRPATVESSALPLPLPHQQTSDVPLVAEPVEPRRETIAPSTLSDAAEAGWIGAGATPPAGQRGTVVVGAKGRIVPTGALKPRPLAALVKDAGLSAPVVAAPVMVAPSLDVSRGRQRVPLPRDDQF